ncbi:tyrosine-type recombinase/integrase [Acetatifactor muris]|uniref:Site-specific tyrosine recombinase XerC n=1 Tax=Acetatifactor muris TaxID=879566 RepID=A0A2K4ZJL2_9FIRM|nr:tyrosine-type recombinase/integrase [Acetatifactor muris]MCI8798273.1 tyrosine-type recombinase/integrase [Lachnospiraceae bacterium]MCR2048959.1 tyrosine-type recombinase/integrase [Acetatifactor muris]SOY30668.1 site-specific tyrosine recombinase XerC [Acetatifactor muris]
MCTTQPIRNAEQLKTFKEYYHSKKPDARNYLLIVIGLNSALRISDILSLTYGDVYDYLKEKWKTHISIREQKTGKQNCIYMNQEIQNALEQYTTPSQHISSSWLFGSQRQQSHPLSRYQAYRIVKNAGVFAGLDQNISCHSLRKTFGYHAWKQGIQPALLMSIYNHSSYNITKRYLCIDQEDRDEVFAKIQL